MLDDQVKVHRYEGKLVKVTGAVDVASNTIRVEIIEEIVQMRFSRRDLNMYPENKDLPTHEQITMRAYAIYLERGFHDGNELADWLAAEKELTELSESKGANKLPEVSRKYATA